MKQKEASLCETLASKVADSPLYVAVRTLHLSYTSVNGRDVDGRWCLRRYQIHLRDIEFEAFPALRMFSLGYRLCTSRSKDFVSAKDLQISKIWTQRPRKSLTKQPEARLERSNDHTDRRRPATFHRVLSVFTTSASQAHLPAVLRWFRRSFAAFWPSRTFCFSHTFSISTWRASSRHNCFSTLPPSPRMSIHISLFPPTSRISSCLPFQNRLSLSCIS